MITPSRLALGSAASLMLCACDPSTPVDPTANLIDNFAIDAGNEAVPPLEPRRDPGPRPAPTTSDQEPRMPTDPTTTPPARPATSPPAKPSAPPARRVILPSPIQPPAEIDPVRPDPGDEVPR